MKYGLSDKQLEEITGKIAGFPEIEEAILFGSRAIDTYKEASDVDVALKGEKVNAALAAKLKFAFEEDTYLPFIFDFVAFPTITNEKLREHIEKKGKVIYRRNDGGGWKECKLGDVCDVRDGTHDSPKQVDYGKPLITSRHIKNGKIDFNTAYHISLADFESVNKRSKVDKYDILFSMIGTVAETAIIDFTPDFAIKNVGLFKTNKNHDLAKWIYYYLKSNSAIAEIDASLKGSTQQYITLSDLREFPILLPPLPEQHAIASILSSLDDKIDLLHRQNKTLEAIAETLFRKWFVEEAETGWEEVELEYVAKRITDGAHQSPSSSDSGMPMASVKDMHQWGIDYSTCRKISKGDYQRLVRDDCRPLKDDILIAKDGSYLKHIFFVPEDMDLVILSSIAIIRPNGKYHPILLSILLKMDSTKDLLKNIVTGAVIPRIVLKDFRKFPIILPPISEQKKALEIIEPLITKCYQNIKKINSLESLRDTLLPKLMSGEVRVSV